MTGELQMFLGQPDRRREPLHVLPMALVLVLAAFFGAASGMIWQSAGLGDASDSAERDEEDDGTAQDDAAEDTTGS